RGLQQRRRVVDADAIKRHRGAANRGAPEWLIGSRWRWRLRRNSSNGRCGGTKGSMCSGEYGVAGLPGLARRQWLGGAIDGRNRPLDGIGHQQKKCRLAVRMSSSSSSSSSTTGGAGRFPRVFEGECSVLSFPPQIAPVFAATYACGRGRRWKCLPESRGDFWACGATDL
ncbi:hypothetical protein U1Q18_052265, partial [Sarracenia purpurea var. burkii]